MKKTALFATIVLLLAVESVTTPVSSAARINGGQSEGGQGQIKGESGEEGGQSYRPNNGKTPKEKCEDKARTKHDACLAKVNRFQPLGMLYAATGKCDRSFGLAMAICRRL